MEMPKAQFCNQPPICNEAKPVNYADPLQAANQPQENHAIKINHKRKLFYWRQWLRIGPGIFIAVGYIDPGNWATDLAGGSYAGYAILSVVLISGLIAMLLQVMSARLGIATGKDLAQLSRETWPKFSWPLWITAEIAIIATDISEVIGSAIALKLLFSIPIIIGVILTVFDVLLFLALGKRNSNFLERLVAFFLFIICCGLVYDIALAQPAIHKIMRGFVPTAQIIQDPQLLYIAIGIIGATIMPHNLYLHSNIVIKRWSGQNKHKAAHFAMIDTILLLSAAIILNCALVILAASVFHPNHAIVSEISDAYHLLLPLLQSNVAAIIFAIMLLASGQSATITGTLAGQVVMNGFVKIKMKPWLRRFITRSLSLLITLIIIVYFGECCTTSLLVASQVLLSLQLPFAMVPLILLTSNKYHVGELANNTFMRQLNYFCISLLFGANIVLIINLCS